MIPFPGESFGCIDAWSSDGYGYGLGNDVYLRGTANSFSPTPGHRTIGAGVQWRCWAYDSDDRPYLEAADDATPLAVSWVVEVLSGSGTLHLSDFLDAGWAYSTSGALPNTLGDLTVSGPGTYVLPTTSFTNANLRRAGWDAGPPEVLIECTSGSIDVQQVKLRVWPASGALGGWSSGTFSQAPTVRNPSILVGAGGNPGEFSTQAAFRAAVESLTLAGYVTSETSITSGGMTAHVAPGSGVRTVVGGIGVAYITRTGTFTYSGPGVDGVDWVRPPNEVQGDVGEVTFQPTGPPVIAWEQPVATLTLTPVVVDGADVYPVAGLFHIGATNQSAMDPVGTPFLGLIGSGEIATPGQAPGPIPEPGRDYVPITLPEFTDVLRVTLWHDGHLDDIAEIGGTGATLTYGITDDGVTFDRLTYSWTPAPYRYWVPTATRVIPLRQYHRDDGLGVTPPRAYGGASRIRTGRAYGYD